MQLSETTFIIPTGEEITIRETNGEDEDVISRVGDASNGASINKYISRIIRGTNIPGKTSMSELDVKNWPLANKYFTLLKSRLQNAGNLLVFEFTCPHCSYKHPTPFEEDLSIYDWDLSKGNPPEDDPHSATRIRKYPMGGQTEFKYTLTSGREISFELLSGKSEEYSLNKRREDISKNDELRSRKLKFKSEQGEWVEVENFRTFSTKEMSQIRGLVNKVDISFNMESTITCQNPRCGIISTVPLIAIPAFFFPTEQI